MTRTNSDDSWATCTIGDVAKVISGYAFKSAEFEEEGVPVIKIKNIRVGYTDLSDAQAVPATRLSLDHKYHVQPGHVLISLTGSHLTQPNSVVGRVAIHRGKHALLNQRAGKFIIDDTKCLPNYLFYTLSSSEYVTRIATMASGAASQANVSPTQVESVSIPLPSIDTQRKIASILSAYDDLIENNTCRIAILEAMAQAIYREWFVNFRFPGHENVKLVDSPLGCQIPEGWRIMDLGEAVEIRRGKNITRKKVVLGSVPVVAGGIKPSCYHNESNTGSPVITVSASGANAGYVSLHHKPVWASDCSFIDPEISPHIYYLYSMFLDRRIEITGLQRGAAQPHVYPKDLMRLKVLDVPEELISRFENDVAPCFRLIGNLLPRIDNLRTTRDLLLPKLISGKLDVGNLDIDVGMTAEALEEATA